VESPPPFVYSLEEPCPISSCPAPRSTMLRCPRLRPWSGLSTPATSTAAFSPSASIAGEPGINRRPDHTLSFPWSVFRAVGAG
jgi:hypothetical protein